MKLLPPLSGVYSLLTLTPILNHLLNSHKALRSYQRSCPAVIKLQNHQYLFILSNKKTILKNQKIEIRVFSFVFVTKITNVCVLERIWITFLFSFWSSYYLK